MNLAEGRQHTPSPQAADGRRASLATLQVSTWDPGAQPRSACGPAAHLWPAASRQRTPSTAPLLRSLQVWGRTLSLGRNCVSLGPRLPSSHRWGYQATERPHAPQHPNPVKAVTWEPGMQGAWQTLCPEQVTRHRQDTPGLGSPAERVPQTWEDVHCWAAGRPAASGCWSPPRATQRLA